MASPIAWSSWREVSGSRPRARGIMKGKLTRDSTKAHKRAYRWSDEHFQPGTVWRYDSHPLSDWEGGFLIRVVERTDLLERGMPKQAVIMDTIDHDGLHQGISLSVETMGDYVKRGTFTEVTEVEWCIARLDGQWSPVEA